MKSPEDQKILEKYIELSKRKVEDKKDIIVIHQADGKVLNLSYKVAIKNMKSYIEAKQGKNLKSPSFFKINKVKQIKKEWSNVSCSLTTDEKKDFLAIAKSNNMTINELLRSIVLKVIENNK